MKYPPAPLTPFLASSSQNLRGIPSHSSATTYSRSRRNTLPFLLPFVFKNLQVPPPTHRFVSHAFSSNCELLFSQLPCFQKHLRCPMLFSSAYSVPPVSVPSLLGSCLQILCCKWLAASCSLLPLFFTRPSFVFSSLQPLFAKCRGWGTSAASLVYPDLRGVARLTPCNGPRPLHTSESKKRNRRRSRGGAGTGVPCPYVGGVTSTRKKGASLWA